MAAVGAAGPQEPARLARPPGPLPLARPPPRCGPREPRSGPRSPPRGRHSLDAARRDRASAGRGHRRAKKEAARPARPRRRRPGAAEPPRDYCRPGRRPKRTESIDACVPLDRGTRFSQCRTTRLARRRRRGSGRNERERFRRPAVLARGRPGARRPRTRSGSAGATRSAATATLGSENATVTTPGVPSRRRHALQCVSTTHPSSVWTSESSRTQTARPSSRSAATTVLLENIRVCRL